MSVFDRLLDSRHLPDYFDKDPHPQQAITLLYSGGTSAVATIDDHTLTTSVDGGAGVNLSIDLTQYATFTALVAAINGFTGYAAVLAAGGNPNAQPSSLLDFTTVDIHSTSLLCFAATSLLWAILRPVAWALEETYTNINAGLMDLDPSTALNGWVDVWGSTLGNVPRKSGESDAIYSTRLIKEVFRQRLTPMALALIILQDTGITVTINGNLYSEVFVVGVTNVGGAFLEDRLHCRTVFFVQIPAGTSNALVVQIINLINRNRMAGTLPVISVGGLVLDTDAVLDTDLVTDTDLPSN